MLFVVPLTMLPLVVHLVMVRSARRPLRIFRDVVAYLYLPILFSSIALPSPISRFALGVALTIGAADLWLILRDYRRSRSTSGRVDGLPPER